MTIRSALRVFANLLPAMLLLHWAGQAAAEQPTAPNAAQLERVAALSSSGGSHSAAGLFGFSLTNAVETGTLVEKWNAARRAIDQERSILSRCAARQDCSAAAKRFLEIVADGRAHNGLARVGVINRAVNLSIIPTTDVKQWGTVDHWSPPLETLTTGRGDCEDYAIAKYVALIDAGVPSQDVKLVIARNRVLDEDHAVVVTRVADDWIVLDNRWLALVPEADVRHLTPLFVIDSSGVRAFVHKDGDVEPASVAR
jgi:predicted transglutaminase-like cysteine proteinase